MKKLVAIILAIVLLVSVAACSSNAATGETANDAAASTAASENTEEAAGESTADWVIGLSNSYYGNTWRKQMVNAFEAAAEEAKAAGLIKDYVVENGDNTVNAQIAQIESFILQGVDAICINAASPTALNDVLQKAMDAGIVVVSFDSNVENLPGCYVMDYDMQQYGSLQGEFVAEKFDGKANVVVVRGISGSAPSEKIYNGYMGVFEQYPDIKVLCEVNGEASTTVTQEELLKVIGNLDHVDAVVTNGGGDSLGAVNAFEQLGMEVPVVIGDGSGEFINWWTAYSAEHDYETISINAAPSCASGAFWTALEILNGNDVPEFLQCALAVVTQENLADYADLQAGEFVAPVFTREFTIQEVIEPAKKG